MGKYLDFKGSKYLVQKLKTWLESAGVVFKAKTADALSATLPIKGGGTGAETAEEAWTALGGGDIGKLNTDKSEEAANKFIKADGTFAAITVPETTTGIVVSDTEPDDPSCIIWIEI